MAQLTARQTRLIGERVRALATILLTRQEDVSIREVTEDIGLDLIVTIHREERPGLHQYRGEDPRRLGQAHGPGGRRGPVPDPAEAAPRRPVSVPGVLFLDAMEDGEGWYAWATEPHIGRDGAFELRANEGASCRWLDAEALDEIIGRVDAWHDAFFAKTIRETSRGRKK